MSKVLYDIIVLALPVILDMFLPEAIPELSVVIVWLLAIIFKQPYFVEAIRFNIPLQKMYFKNENVKNLIKY